MTATTSVFFNYAINTQNPLLNNIFQNTAIGTAGEANPCGFAGDQNAAIATSGRRRSSTAAVQSPSPGSGTVSIAAPAAAASSHQA